jgi:hypothetical protein
VAAGPSSSSVEGLVMGSSELGFGSFKMMFEFVGWLRVGLVLTTSVEY